MVKEKSLLEEEINLEEFYHGFAIDVNSIIEDGSHIPNIIEFIDLEVDLGIQLTKQQLLILKTLYGIELDEEDTSILEYWKSINKTTWTGDNEFYQILILEAGRRSGKSSLASIICAYEFYCLCRLPCPQRYFGIATSSPITILVLATTAEQAKKSIFRSTIGIFNNSKYFKSLVNQGKIFIGKEEITYDEKLIYLTSGNSRSSGQVGGNIKCLVMDEVARFSDTEGKSNAIELWDNLGISCAPFKDKAIRVAISSAWFEGDAIQELYESTSEDPVALGIRCKSWDMNPVFAARNNSVINSYYIKDPVQAALEIEGIRPATVDAYLNPAEIQRAFTGTCAVTAEAYTSSSKLSCLNIVKSAEVHNPVVVFVDPAIVNDSYALAMGHNYFTEDGTHLYVVDAVLSWEPSQGVEVSVTDVSDTIVSLTKLFNVVKVGADHYMRSEAQRLRMNGIVSETTYFSNAKQVEMYKRIRELLHENRLILPASFNWKQTLIRELSQLQLVNGSKIDHPKEGSKDLADAIAGLCHHLSNRYIVDKPEVKKTKKSTTKPINNNGRYTFPPTTTTYRQKVLSNINIKRNRNKYTNSNNNY
jgi:hypothetical protein